MKLYVKSVKCCWECPACFKGPEIYYCRIAQRPIPLTDTPESDPAITVMPWCPLEDVKK